MEAMPAMELTIVLGQYAIAWHLPEEIRYRGRKKKTLTEIVEGWQQLWPNTLVLPHPSPRNNLWLKRNPWLETDVIPLLREQIQALLNKPD